jgi:23S rRNA (pseudouridine1915-N3)-methyltransferase
MKVLLVTISPRRAGASGPAAELMNTYMERSARYVPCMVQNFASEVKMLDFVGDTAGRTKPTLWLTDSRGTQVSSTELASWFGTFQDGGGQQLILAVGPADGWSAGALARADRTLAFGRITLPHELAAVIVAEQFYRALTIRAGHPYHSGH